MSTFAEGLDLNNLTPITPAWEFVKAVHKFVDPMGETRIIPPEGLTAEGITEPPIVPFPGIVERDLPNPVRGQEYIFTRDNTIAAQQHPDLNAVRWAEHAHIRKRYPREIVRLSQLSFERHDDYDVVDAWGDLRYHSESGIVRYNAYYDPSRNPYDAFVVSKTTLFPERYGTDQPYHHQQVSEKELTGLNHYLEWCIRRHFACKVNGWAPYDTPSDEAQTK